MKRLQWIPVFLIFTMSVFVCALTGCEGKNPTAPENLIGKVEKPLYTISSIPDKAPLPGLASLADIQALPLLRPGVVARQFSSHDPTGGNNDGFAGDSQIYIDNNGQYVLFDDFGPGCIYRMWFTGTADPIQKIFIYIEDMNIPKFEATFEEFFESKKVPFVFPLTLSDKKSSGGSVSYLPIPYQHRAKITTSRPPRFFNINFLRYPYGTAISTFTGGENSDQVFYQWLNPGRDPKPYLPTETITTQQTVAPGQSALVLEKNGAGAVWNLYMDARPLSRSALASVWIIAKWDGHEKADVEAPLPEFFGSYLPEKAPVSLPVGRKDGRFYFYLPMPYWEKADIRIENRGQQEVQISFLAQLTNKPYPKGAGYFKALANHQSPTEKNKDYLFAQIKGAGHFVGVTYSIGGYDMRKYLQGDERFYIDGATSPAVYGTGTEDYFNGGWLFKYGTFNRAVHGNTVGSHLVESMMFTSCYRFHIGDLIPFYAGAKFGIEHDGENAETEQIASSVAYFYARSTPLLKLTDRLDMGDSGSEATHQYAAIGRAPTQVVESAFEGETQGNKIKGVVVMVSRQCEMTFAVDKNNDGVFLRRRLDQKNGRQLAEVFVDDEPAGNWYDAVKNETLRFANSDFFLPAYLTKDKESIRVRLVSKGENPWTQLGYEVYSIARQTPDKN